MKFKLSLILFLFSLAVSAQEKGTISGYIKDSKNGESLIGATIYKLGSSTGAAANEYGFYSLTLPKGQHVIAVSLIGYKTYTFSINLDKSITKNIEIGEEGLDLEEVVITGEAEDKNITSVEMSVAKLDIKQINKIPALLGEVEHRDVQRLCGSSDQRQHRMLQRLVRGREVALQFCATVEPSTGAVIVTPGPR